MKRDMELVRRLLLIVEKEIGHGSIEIESDENPFTSPSPIFKHFPLLIEAGYIKGTVHAYGAREQDGVIYQLYGFEDVELTWKGHEFLDTIRDDEVWRRTKEGARKMGGASMEFVWELAKAYGKQALMVQTGITLP